MKKKKPKLKPTLKPKLKPKPAAQSKVKAKPKTKPGAAVRHTGAAKKSKPRRTQAINVAAVDFPAPGGQDCYAVPPAVDPATFTASIDMSNSPGVVINTVRLTIGNNAPILATAINPQGNNLYYAVFAGVTLAGGNLTPNTPCVLVVETSDQTSVGFCFTYVPPPPPPPPPAPQISLSSTPGPSNSLSVTATASNINLATISATPTNGSIPTSFPPTSSPFTFTFNATSASPQPSVTINAQDATGVETLAFVFDLNADFTPPTFENGPTPASEEDSLIIAGEINDPSSATSPASGITASPSPLSNISITAPDGTPATYTLQPLVQVSASVVTYLFVVTAPLQQGNYTLNMTVTDNSGNLASGSWPLLYSPPTHP